MLPKLFHKAKGRTVIFHKVTGPNFFSWGVTAPGKLFDTSKTIELNALSSLKITSLNFDSV